MPPYDGMNPLDKFPHPFMSVRLYHFDKKEFRDHWDLMDRRLLVSLDLLRRDWDAPVYISPDPDSLGRTEGGTRHDYKKHGKIYAADVFPECDDSRPARADAHSFYCLASQYFTGIGVYADTKFRGKRHVMFHLDTRTDRYISDPAEWGRVDYEYVSIEKAFEEIGKWSS